MNRITKTTTQLHGKFFIDENSKPLKFDADRKTYFDLFPELNSFQLMAEGKGEYNSNCYPRVFHCKGMPDESWLLKLEDLNSQGMCLSINACEGNGKSRRADDMEKCRAIVLDLDGSPLNPVLKDNPSMIIETSPGRYHCYFMCDNVPLAGFSQLQKSVALKYNGDKQVFDKSKAFRIPGFLHMKKDPWLVKIVEKNDRRFGFEELTEMFPPEKVKVWSAPKWDKKDVSNPNDPFTGVLGASEGNRNHHLIKRLGGCKKRGLSWGQIEAEAYREGAACDPPMKESEIKATLKSFRKYM